MTGQTFGDYRILAPLGSGGMGVVYAAEDTRLHRKVAIKFLAADAVGDDERRRQRLLYEARAAAALDHPNICTIHDVGEAQGRTFIVMQLVEGDTLAATLARGSAGDCLVGLAGTGAYGWWPVSGAIDSIAVLPLVNTTGDAQLDYQTEGITDAIIETLSRLPDLKVMSRNAICARESLSSRRAGNRTQHFTDDITRWTARVVARPARRQRRRVPMARAALRGA